MTTASWIVKRIADGAVLFETFNPKLVKALNTDKYVAVPILEYLVSINGKRG